jgi:hypothetical protein
MSVKEDLVQEAVTRMYESSGKVKERANGKYSMKYRALAWISGAMRSMSLPDGGFFRLAVLFLPVGKVVIYGAAKPNWKLPWVLGAAAFVFGFWTAKYGGPGHTVRQVSRLSLAIPRLALLNEIERSGP